MPRASLAPSALAGAPFGVDEGAQIVEAISGEESRCHQFPERRFDFGFQFAGSAHNVGEEEAPRWRMNSSTSRATWLRARDATVSEAWRGIIQSDSSRTKNVMGATLEGVMRRAAMAGMSFRARSLSS